MNFSYKEAVLSKTIRKYVVKNGKINIFYLDESADIMPYTIENEEKIQQMMILQALERKNSNIDEAIATDATDFYNKLTANVLFDLASLFGVTFTSTEELHILLNCGIAFLAGITINNGIEYISNLKKLEELAKYDIFLKIRLELDQYPQLLDRFKKLRKRLSINTIDNYSLKEIEKIRENLEILQLQDSIASKVKVLNSGNHSV